jgi:ribose transport system permease protein
VQPSPSSTASAPAVADHAVLDEVVGVREQTMFQKLVSAQSFWVAVALLVLMLFMTALEPTFGTAENLTNISRNFAPIGIMALGMTVVLITGGIDLSVGSVMGLVAIVAGLFLTWHYPWYVAFSMGMLTGLACGVFNGFFVAYVGMPSFVVTLGMLSIARSLAVVFSGNQMLYQFGPDAPIVRRSARRNGRCISPPAGRRPGCRSSRRISGRWSCSP